jgi:mannonate dehydratase
MIKLGVRYASTSREHLQLLRQLGVEGGTLRWIKLPGAEATGGHVDREGFRALLDRFAEFDLALGGMELSRPLLTGVLQGAAGRAAGEVDAFCETIRLLGDHGIDLVTCGFAIAHADEAQHDWRGYRDEPLGRAGAVLRTFDAARLDAGDLVTWGGNGADGPRVPEEEVWRRLDRFMDAVLPVARAAGVRLGFHPNDPPLPVYRGVAQPFATPEGLGVLLDRYADPGVGLLFCLGTLQESGGDMTGALRRFGAQGKLFAIHFRNVRGTVPRFHEVFPDEGDFDAAAHMRLLHEAGFDGYVMPDHYPGVVGDTADNDLARAWCLGYLRALIQSTS